MSRNLPQCDHDECPPPNCKRYGSFAVAAGSDAEKDLALQLWMQDVTSLLCYQPEVPLAHKESLVKALDHYNKRCAEADEAKRQNDQAQRPEAE